MPVAKNDVVEEHAVRAAAAVADWIIRLGLKRGGVALTGSHTDVAVAHVDPAVFHHNVLAASDVQTVAVRPATHVVVLLG